MPRTPNQNKALAWYCEQNGLIPQLSTHPVYIFRDKQGNETKRNIEFIVRDWERWRKENRNGKTGVRRR